LGEQNDVSYAAGFLCGSYGFAGDFEKAFAYGEQAIKITEETGNLSRKANGYMWLSIGYLLQGTWIKVIENCNQAIEIARPLGENLPIINGLSWLGGGLFMKGNRDEGLLKMQEGIKVMENTKIYLLYSAHYCHIAYCYAKAEMMEEAMDTANNGLEWAQKGMKGLECLAYYALALVEAQKKQSNPQLVDETIEKGLRLCQERGQRPYLAQGYFEYAQILFNRKDQQKAKNYLNQAIKLFSEMNMSSWLEQARELEKRVG